MNRSARDFARSAVRGALGFGLLILLMVAFVVLAFLGNLVVVFLLAPPS